MSAEDAAMNSMTSSMNLALNGTVYACKGTAYVLSHLFKFLMWLHLESQKKKEIEPGKKKLAAMIAAGKKTSVISMKKSEYDKMSEKNLANKGVSLAEKYGIQYAAIDQTKTKDNDKDYVTLFVDVNHMGQFMQMTKDYGFTSIEEHGTIESMPEKPFSPETLKDLFEDKSQLSKYVDSPDVHDNTAKFDVAKFYHDEISKGMDPDGFITELSEPLIELCVANQYLIDMTGIGIHIPELEKEVERLQKGEPEPVTPAVTDPSVMSNDATKSSEKQTEPLQENEMGTEISESDIFEAISMDPAEGLDSEPALTDFDAAVSGSDPLSYEEKITEVTEEAKTTDIADNLDASFDPEMIAGD